tara:strand:+ start:1289 stop:1450 length:162 start_codon:yes stop_codon:yes gene_type:complete
LKPWELKPTGEKERLKFFALGALIQETKAMTLACRSILMMVYIFATTAILAVE